MLEEISSVSIISQPVFPFSRINTMAALINHEASISLAISAAAATHPQEISCAVHKEIGLAVLLFESSGAKL